jgi:hypothetical protein
MEIGIIDSLVTEAGKYVILLLLSLMKLLANGH